MTLQQTLGSRWPLIQAPMAGVQGSALAIAVSNAGGLGSLPCAMLSADALRAELQRIQAETPEPYNVNFFCHRQPKADDAAEQRWRLALAPYYKEYGIDPDSIEAGAGRQSFDEAMADVLSEFEPPVVSFHFGLPEEPLLRRVKAWGATVLSSATTVDEARWLEAHGVDVIIAQGVEAGGHRGMFLNDDLTQQMGTFALLPQVVASVQVPVIAAGGIADVSGIKAALALGAQGVQVGTAYMLCPEATTSAVHRSALVGPSAGHTALTNIFSGRPARGIVNRLMQEMGCISAVPPDFPLAASALAPLRAACERRGKGDFSPLWAGQNASGCRALPAAELTRELVAAFS
ncbi:nitronate monooxygenase [Salinispirillum sp. LH 10-3-1]|uniref:Nitronate monooxygenase n=1 Tax=Salinispirillum sp. LH 10-3-1 TaxID=2952525 RepID=A0AB38YGN9_9GAMM